MQEDRKGGALETIWVGKPFTHCAGGGSGVRNADENHRTIMRKKKEIGNCDFS